MEVWQSRVPQITVQYENGRLTVSAHNAVLRNVLEQIGRRTGTTIDLTTSAMTEPVYVELGPGTVQEVLAELLNGSPANYLMLGSASKPGFVDRLILLPRNQSPSSSGGVVANVNTAGGPRAYSNSFATGSDSTGGALEVPSALQEDDETAAYPSTAPPPVQRAIDPTMVQYQQAAAAAAASGKSRGEILDELQKLQIKQLDEEASRQEQQRQ